MHAATDLIVETDDTGESGARAAISDPISGPTASADIARPRLLSIALI